MSLLTKLKKSVFLSYILRIYGAIVSLPFGLISREKVKPPKNVYHCEWIRYLSKKYNFENMKILEIGSRNVTGTNLRKYFNKAEYIGFDFHEGENVDVVGDAHYLSRYFENKKFDLIFSSSVFEHLMMPWIVAEEISKILKLGGNVFIETELDKPEAYKVVGTRDEVKEITNSAGEVEYVVTKTEEIKEYCGETLDVRATLLSLLERATAQDAVIADLTRQLTELKGGSN